ncbi:hypothetical protein Droror1_Dr00015597 [Drosera rotundifolia]
MATCGCELSSNGFLQHVDSLDPIFPCFIHHLTNRISSSFPSSPTMSSSASAIRCSSGSAPLGFRWSAENRNVRSAPRNLVIPRASVTEPSTGKRLRRKKKEEKVKEEAVVVVAEEEKRGEDVNGDAAATATAVEAERKDEGSQLGLQPVSVIKKLDEVNPFGLGRKSRQIFDEVWRKFSGLGQISRTTLLDDTVLVREEVRAPFCEFTVPGAQNTTVLVVGATSRIGRIVVRKLMLRGYTVKALVRKIDDEVKDMLPTSVELVVGDVGDSSTLKDAVQGCNKIIYCATARSTITGDLNRVDRQGVSNVSKALQDFNNDLAKLRAGKSSKSKLLIAKFKSEVSLDEWDLELKNRYKVLSEYDDTDDFAEFGWEEETKSAVFTGFVSTRGSYAELSRPLSLPLGNTLDRYEGLVLSVGGNGRSYSLILKAGPAANRSQSKLYYVRFNTKVGYCRIRIPFSAFRPVNASDPPLDPFLVHTLTIRFEPKRRRPIDESADEEDDPRSFRLTLGYIKALPTGQETDFVLVSCTGLAVDPSRRDQVLKAKRAGEDSLRRSGLGYTIIRPGPLREEPGGQRALIFDQGNRISQGISCADVADICVKALHDSTARNKSFDVCYEYVDEQGQDRYELVAHLPDKANNYLTPALSILEKNT